MKNDILGEWKEYFSIRMKKAYSRKKSNGEEVWLMFYWLWLKYHCPSISTKKAYYLSAGESEESWKESMMTCRYDYLIFCILYSIIIRYYSYLLLKEENSDDDTYSLSRWLMMNGSDMWRKWKYYSEKVLGNLYSLLFILFLHGEGKIQKWRESEMFFYSIRSSLMQKKMCRLWYIHVY